MYYQCIDIQWLFTMYSFKACAGRGRREMKQDTTINLSPSDRLTTAFYFTYGLELNSAYKFGRSEYTREIDTCKTSPLCGDDKNVQLTDRWLCHGAKINLA